MRAYPQAAGARLRTTTPGRHWATRLEETMQRRRERRAEQLETIERLEREQRQARRSGQSGRDLRRVW